MFLAPGLEPAVMDGKTFWRMIVKRTFFIRHSLMAACVTLTAAVAQAQTAAPTQKPYEPQSGQAGKDVVWVPTPQALVEKMLDMAKATPQDFVMDLGSGDGRTVITAAKRGIRAMGIEYNPDMVELSKKNAAAAGVTDKATFMKADLFETDFSKASVITMFLLPSINMKLRPKILDLKPGTRVVSNSFTMEDWEPDQTEVVKDDCTSYCTALLWIVPAKVEGIVVAAARGTGGDAAVPEAHRDARSDADLERPPAWRRDHLHRRQCEVHGKGDRQFDEGDDHRRPRRLLDGNEERRRANPDHLHTPWRHFSRQAHMVGRASQRDRAAAGQILRNVITGPHPQRHFRTSLLFAVVEEEQDALGAGFDVPCFER